MTAAQQAQLDMLPTLGRNWDGYGADPVTPAAVAAARALVGMLAPGGAPVEVHPARHGGAALIWWEDDEECGIDISPDGQIEHGRAVVPGTLAGLK